MDPRLTTFAIPTYRLRDVGEAIERYDENFWRNGKATRLVVFDDSTQAMHQKYYPLLEQTRTHNELYYVGPKEKAEFVRILMARLGDRRLDSVVKNLFRPSYGGNRNFTLMYTLGGFLVSADDDMRPDALLGNNAESLADQEISRGKLMRATSDGFTRRSFDILRNPPAAEIFNEEICTLMKRKIKSSLRTLEDLTMSFDYDGEVESSDTAEILERITSLHRRVVDCARVTTSGERRQSLLTFAENLEKAFYGFEADFFQQNVARIVDDVVSQIQGALALWPTLVEICYFHKHTRDLPLRKVRNVRLDPGSSSGR